MSIEEVESMDLDRVRNWMEYFTIINGNKKEEEIEENNVAGFMQFLQGKEKK